MSLQCEFCLLPPDLLPELIARASFYSELFLPPPFLSTCFLMVVLEPLFLESFVVLVKGALRGSALQRVSGVGEDVEICISNELLVINMHTELGNSSLTHF